MSANLKASLINRLNYWAPIALGVTCLFLAMCIKPDTFLKAQNDFTAFYDGAKLVWTPGLYSRTANIEQMKKIHPELTDGSLVDAQYIRPPFYAVFLAPFGFFPYKMAYIVYCLIMWSCLLWFIIRFAKECPDLPVFAAYSIPIFVTVHVAQDTPLLLVIFGTSLLLTRQGRDFAAGAVLSLLAIKFHLFLFIPIFLVLKKRWQILAGGACGIGGLTLVSLLAGHGSPDIFRQWVQMMKDPKIATSVIPNLHGLVSSIGGGLPMELALMATVASAYVWIVLKTDNYELLLASSIIAGLLISFHCGIPDDILLFFVFVLVTSQGASVWVRSTLGLAMTPVPYILGLADDRFVGILPVLLIALMGTFVFEAYRTSSTRAPQLAPQAA